MSNTIPEDASVTRYLDGRARLFWMCVRLVVILTWRIYVNTTPAILHIPLPSRDHDQLRGEVEDLTKQIEDLLYFGVKIK